MKTAGDVSTKSWNVGMGELYRARPPEKLYTLGLGSCLALVFYDTRAEVAAMAHIMLPKSPANGKETEKPGKFADTAIPRLLEVLEEAGAERRRIRAKVAGGAKMFNIASSSPLMAIGQQNIQAVKEGLKAHGIPLEAEDTGGSRGRSVTFDTTSWKLQVKTLGEGIKVL
ncbi:MAG: chemotaxis protein CheD [Synergistales bacterium]|jgi:chemotaxis protein CheD|nr:chemotaxis protein CheD [Synergistales bacterium]